MEPVFVVETRYFIETARGESPPGMISEPICRLKDDISGLRLPPAVDESQKSYRMVLS